MNKEDKELLLKDLFGRLPYGIECKDQYGEYIDINIYNAHLEHLVDQISSGGIKMVLRPMSSMTGEECVELSKIRPSDDEVEAWKYIKTPVPLKIANIKHFDFFHSHHLDWRGLIEKGLALEATDGIYNLNEK